MKMLKKIIGTLIILIFVSFLTACVAYNIYEDGWYFILSTLFVICAVGLFWVGVYFLTSDK